MEVVLVLMLMLMLMLVLRSKAWLRRLRWWLLRSGGRLLLHVLAEDRSVARGTHLVLLQPAPQAVRMQNVPAWKSLSCNHIISADHANRVIESCKVLSLSISTFQLTAPKLDLTSRVASGNRSFMFAVARR
jgi:hypothetical protein